VPEAYCTRVTFRLYAEEADDAANKVSQRKRIGMSLVCSVSRYPGRAMNLFKESYESWPLLLVAGVLSSQ
jgi:hypothetical protein